MVIIDKFIDGSLLEPIINIFINIFLNFSTLQTIKLNWVMENWEGISKGCYMRFIANQIPAPIQWLLSHRHVLWMDQKRTATQLYQSSFNMNDGLLDTTSHSVHSIGKNGTDRQLFSNGSLYFHWHGLSRIEVRGKGSSINETFYPQIAIWVSNQTFFL